MNNKPIGYVDLKYIVKYLSLSKETVYRLLYRKQIPAYKIGRKWVFDLKEIDAWVKSSPHKVL